jgi:hypothetical protein
LTLDVQSGSYCGKVADCGAQHPTPHSSSEIGANLNRSKTGAKRLSSKSCSFSQLQSTVSGAGSLLLADGNPTLRVHWADSKMHPAQIVAWHLGRLLIMKVFMDASTTQRQTGSRVGRCRDEPEPENVAQLVEEPKFGHGNRDTPGQIHPNHLPVQQASEDHS